MRRLGLPKLELGAFVESAVLPGPDSISGLAFWFDPSDAPTVTLNGSDVASISDKSGNSRTASQGTAANQPLLDTGAIGGRNAITFTGANSDALPLTNGLGFSNAAPGLTVAGVVKMAALASGQQLVTIFGGTGFSRLGLTLGSTGLLSATTRRLDADATDSKSTTAQVTIGTASFFLGEVDYATGAVTLQIDGTSRVQTAAWTAGAASSATNSSLAPVLGKNPSGSLSGTLGELAGYARALSTNEIATLRAYLKAKWGLA